MANEEHVALLKPGVEVSRADLLSGLHDPLLSVRWPHLFDRRNIAQTRLESETRGSGDSAHRWLTRMEVLS